MSGRVLKTHEVLSALGRALGRKLYKHDGHFSEFLVNFERIFLVTSGLRAG
jgi:hypothetical protein